MLVAVLVCGSTNNVPKRNLIATHSEEDFNRPSRNRVGEFTM